MKRNHKFHQKCSDISFFVIYMQNYCLQRVCNDQTKASQATCSITKASSRHDLRIRTAAELRAYPLSILYIVLSNTNLTNPSDCIWSVVRLIFSSIVCPSELLPSFHGRCRRGQCTIWWLHALHVVIPFQFNRGSFFWV